jgi:2-isopropylmalate synthase
VRAGARQIECTINGLGERAGNAALEEIVMAMNVRRDVLPYWNEVDTTKFVRASKLVAAVSAFPVQYNKAVVGRNAFAHESGIHQDGMLKNVETYEIMKPETVGLSKSTLSLGKLSGRAAFRDKLKQLGYQLGDNAFQDAFKRFKDLADKKKLVFDEDIEALVDQEVASQYDRIRVVALEVHAGTKGPQRAIITLEIDGVAKTQEASGDGPVDSIFKAIKAIVPHEARLPLYQVMAVTEGTDAQAEVMVRLEEAGREVTGRGADTDTMVASARAYVAALNKLVMKRERGPNAQAMVG